jgi:saccharopine dehydrogenase-like NADP-dependent oxidoreductase
MKKVLIVGAGAQGGPCASILSRDDSISEIRVADIDLELAQAVQKKIGGSKIKAMQLDASNLEAVTKAAEGVDIIINLTIMDFNDIIIQAALANKIHYIDTAQNDTYLDQMMENKHPLDQEEEFKSIGKTALLGCGAAPGITNVTVRYICDQMEEVEKIYIRLGVKYLETGDDVVHGWNPGWSPVGALMDYAERPCVYKNGEYTRVPIFSRAEEYPFPEPVGKSLISSHSHEEPYTLPYYIKKGLKEVDFKYPVDPIAGALVKMGFGDEEEIEVRGNKMYPIEVLMQMVPRVADAFLEETEETIKEGGDTEGVLEVKVDGVMMGRKVTYAAWLENSSVDPAINQYLYETFGTTQIMIPLPASAGAKMCLNGMTDPGVISSECLNPEKFFKVMADMGLPMTLREQITSEKSFI